jgi:hypothetical protein
VFGVPNEAGKSTVFYVDHHRYDISGGEEDWDEPEDLPHDGLLTGPDRRVQVRTGTDWGNVRVTVKMLDDAPAEAQPGTYEMISERDLEMAGDVIEIAPITAVDSRIVLPASADRYRVRVSVRGRGAASQGTEGAEQHLVEIWPSPADQPPIIVAGPDEYAIAYLNLS